MSYLLEHIKYQYNPTLFKLEKLENDLRKGLHALSVRSSTTSKEQASSLLKNSEKELNVLKDQIKGINWYAFIFGFAAYHTAYIFRTKILMNEMGNKVFAHLAICTAFGLLTGSFVGYSFASNYRLYKKHNQIRRELAKALEQAK